MNLKTLAGFVAGAVFVLGLVVTCGNGSKGGGTANAGGGTDWEYAYCTTQNLVRVPTTAMAPDISSCKGELVCILNTMGADAWELVSVDGSYYIFKRPK